MEQLVFIVCVGDRIHFNSTFAPIYSTKQDNNEVNPMKIILTLISASIAITSTNANEAPCPKSIKTALQELHTISEIKDYTCGPNIDCTLENFSNALEISNTQLHVNAVAPDAIQITPKTKGASYFTAIFLIENCKSRLIFYPDTSSSGIKLLKLSSNGMFIIRSTARESRTQWSETDYHYDLNKQAYQEQRTVCYAISATQTVKIKCQQNNKTLQWHSCTLILSMVSGKNTTNC